VAKRGTKLVVGLILFAVLVSAAAVALMLIAVGRQPSVASNSTLVLTLDSDLHEVPTDGVVRQLLEGNQPSGLRAVLDNLRKAKADSRVGAVLVVPTGLQAQLWAKVQEVHDAIVDFRESGKPAVAFLEYGGEREYYIASACDRIFLMPSGSLDINGLASYEVFFRGTLDKIGVYPDILHIGEYKTAYNTFTERGYTPAHREMSESLNHDLFEQFVAATAEGRHKTPEEVRALIDRGPFSAEEALEAGLVDDLAYPDQIDDRMDLPGGGLKRLSADDYGRVSKGALGLDSGPKIAVIYATGVITSGEGGYDPLMGPVLGSETLNRYIRDARADTSIRAIVLRIDSPGGAATASDAIWRELVLTRDEKRDRPLVASMSDVAASGGYWIAMAAPYIVAQPGTLTGSIGVITGKMVTGGLYEKLGANIESVSEGRHAELASPARPFNEEERARIATLMEDTYQDFIEKAAESRNVTPEKIDAIGRGRVWTGRQAKNVGLVDELGGLDAAIHAAKTRAGIGADQKVRIVVYPPRRSVYELLSQSLRTEEATAFDLLPTIDRRALAMALAPARLFRAGEPLALMPWRGVE
jgi:protease IV